MAEWLGMGLQSPVTGFDSRRRLNCLQIYIGIWYAKRCFWYVCCGTGINWKRRAFESFNAHDNTTAIGLLGVNGRTDCFDSDVIPGVVKIIDASDIKHDVTYE